MKNSETPVLKLNYRRTALIGFAFFGILLLWQVYDSWCPTFLTDIFARSFYDLSSAELKASAPEKLLHVQWIVGIIMACDNLAALILLPIFGNLSDRTRTPIGKRMPYILVGTFVSALAFPFIPLFFHRNNILGMVTMMAVVLLFMMMYRNPAVSLMPDITPKPLRAKANGIINIMGYFGGAFATVLGILFVLSSYINAPVAERNLWTIELPFIIASVLMVISALVLFASIKENRVEAEIRDELALGERLAAVETPIDDNKPMSRANRTMLLAILGAEFLWFMSDNALGTYIGNYVIYHLESSSSATMILTILGGLASVLGFAIARRRAARSASAENSPSRLFSMLSGFSRASGWRLCITAPSPWWWSSVLPKRSGNLPVIITLPACPPRPSHRFCSALCSMQRWPGVRFLYTPPS